MYEFLKPNPVSLDNIKLNNVIINTNSDLYEQLVFDFVECEPNPNNNDIARKNMIRNSSMTITFDIPKDPNTNEDLLDTSIYKVTCEKINLATEEEPPFYQFEISLGKAGTAQNPIQKMNDIFNPAKNRARQNSENAWKFPTSVTWNITNTTEANGFSYLVIKNLVIKIKITNCTDKSSSTIEYPVIKIKSGELEKNIIAIKYTKYSFDYKLKLADNLDTSGDILSVIQDMTTIFNDLINGGPLAAEELYYDDKSYSATGNNGVGGQYSTQDGIYSALNEFIRSKLNYIENNIVKIAKESNINLLENNKEYKITIEDITNNNEAECVCGTNMDANTELTDSITKLEKNKALLVSGYKQFTTERDKYKELLEWERERNKWDYR
jgi:hypothetical protein